MQRPLYMRPQDALEYGIIDEIIKPNAAKQEKAVEYWVRSGRAESEGRLEQWQEYLSLQEEYALKDSFKKVRVWQVKVVGVSHLRGVEAVRNGRSLGRSMQASPSLGLTSNPTPRGGGQGLQVGGHWQGTTAVYLVSFSLCVPVFVVSPAGHKKLSSHRLWAKSCGTATVRLPVICWGSQRRTRQIWSSSRAPFPLR